MESEQICISVMEASEIIGVGRSSIYKLIKQPGFPWVKIGNTYRIPKTALNEWIKDNCRKEIVLD